MCLLCSRVLRSEPEIRVCTKCKSGPREQNRVAGDTIEFMPVVIFSCVADNERSSSVGRN